MPYEVCFTKKVIFKNTNTYLNDCCWGGDAVRDQLLPLISQKFEDVQTNQEDWGWFIWFRQGAVHLAIDIFCDDPINGKFRIHLTSTMKKLLWFYRAVDTPELDSIREIVCSSIRVWAGDCSVQRIEL